MKTFLPEQWANVPSKDTLPTTATVKDGMQQTAPQYNNTNGEETRDKVERIVQLIEQRGIDITAGYDVWLRIGFAFASEFGEGGRDFFHRVSRQNSKYDYHEADKQYNNCLSSKGEGITIGTFFQMAKDAGIDVHNTKKQNGNLAILHFGNNSPIATNIQNSKYPKCKTDFSTSAPDTTADELPHLPAEVFDALPPFLKKICDTAASRNDKDIILLGTLVALSSTLHRIRAAYGERTVYPNLNLFVVADAGMGKGVLSLCRNLIAPIHEARLSVGQQQREEYELQKQAHKSGGTDIDNIKEPGWLMHIIPANSSSTSFIQILNDNDGIGIMFETEGDTLANILKQDYGNFPMPSGRPFIMRPSPTPAARIMSMLR